MNVLIIDWNNLAMAKLYSKDVMKRKKYDIEDIDYNVWKFKMVTEIYNFIIYSSNIKEVVIAIDYPYSWRKIVFPRYKEHRLKIKSKFNIDWKEYNEISNDFIEELKSHFPFKFIQIKYCEGDDIIGAITLNRKNNKIKIISSDSDNLQLCAKDVKIYSLKKRDEIKHPNPEMFLQESSLIGQQKDNIFNILTPLDYPSELRKPAFGKKKAEKFLIKGLEKSLDCDIEYKRKYKNEDGLAQVYNSKINLKERYDFNRNLIDYSRIPNTLSKAILNKYKKYKYPNPEKIINFFSRYNWIHFLDNITAVENNLYKLYESERND